MGVVTYILSTLTVFVLNTTAWSLRNLMMPGSRVSRATVGNIDIGMQIALEECQAQFKWDRWNCPEADFDIVPKHRKLRATRETAFVHAMLSAGITYSLTRNCSRGLSKSCPCDPRPRKLPQGADWRWGGCSDNVKFGDRVSRRFLLDKVEAYRDMNAMMNLHNSRVGRVAVRKSMQRTCKCHGPSGSCSAKTCWKKLGKMSDVGKLLRQAYDQADLLNVNTNKPSWEPFKNVLLYQSPSQNFCRKNRRLGRNGTFGRECSRRTGSDVPAMERASCRNLCYDCGLDVRPGVAAKISSCNCRFVWCCSVRCDICTSNVRKYYCS
ncbi:protein Wnt-8c-like [Haemaphysalis longicornis]